MARTLYVQTYNTAFSKCKKQFNIIYIIIRAPVNASIYI